jgi:deoxyribodipyrimidine photo-lyase
VKRHYRTALVWLRRDLRLVDQAALSRALTEAESVIPVFLFDKAILDPLPRADRRVEFIFETIAGLKAELNARGSDLLVRRGHAEIEIPRLAEALGADAIYCGRDYEPAAIARDAEVERRLAALGFPLHAVKDQVIFEQEEIVTAAGQGYGVFTPYKAAWLKALEPGHTAPRPVGPRAQAFATREPEPMIPLEALGFERTDLKALGVQPGPAGAEALLADFGTRVDAYRDARNYPAVKGPSYLSVHLRFGTVSIRHLVRFALERGGEGASTWLSELIWREFYQQLLWRRPDTAEHAFQQVFDRLDYPNDERLFEAWRDGRTGYPLVDAAMRQLNTTGYMHNRLRMVTASFLTKDLLVDWRWGERYFAEKLLDYDMASNVGGWQWSASVGCDAQPWFRIFNPVTQSKTFDAEGRFIRRFVPELEGLTEKAIHEPWTAMPLELAEGGVALGKTYPHPVVDHAEQRPKALALFQKAKSG